MKVWLLTTMPYPYRQWETLFRFLVTCSIGGLEKTSTKGI